MEQRRKIFGVIASSILKTVAPTLISATIEDASPTDIVMVFDQVVTGTNLGFTINGTTSSTFASISGSGTNTITGVLAVAAVDGETITLDYNDAVGDIQGTSLPLATFSGTSVTNNVGFDFSTVDVIYSLRKFNSWTKAVFKVRRSSDDAVKFVFFDGDTVTLSSFVSDTNHTPSGTTLGTWITTDDGYVEEWLGQTPDDTVDSNKIGVQATLAKQPILVSSGTINTKNGKVTLDFTTAVRYLTAPAANGSLDSADSFSIFNVANGITSAYLGVIMSTSTGGNKFTIFHDRGTIKALAQIISPGNVVVNYSAQHNDSDQRLTTAIKDSTDAKGYLDGAFQETEGWTGTYVNDTLFIGIEQSEGSRHNGSIQEIIIFPSDKTADLTAIHGNINTYYSIY